MESFRLPITRHCSRPFHVLPTYLNPETDEDPAMLPFPAFHTGETPGSIQNGNVPLHLPQRLALSSNN